MHIQLEVGALSQFKKKSEGVGVEKQVWWHIGHIGHGIEEEGMMGELL